MGPGWPKLAPGQPQDGPKMAQDGPKMAPRRPKTAHDGIVKPLKFIGQNGFSQYEALLRLSWLQDGSRWLRDRPEKAQDGPRLSQDGPRWPQDGPKMAPRRPKMAPRWLNMAPRWPQDGPRQPQNATGDHPEPLNAIGGSVWGHLETPTAMEETSGSPALDPWGTASRTPPADYRQCCVWKIDGSAE